jgi:hypothetical protein
VDPVYEIVRGVDLLSAILEEIMNLTIKIVEKAKQKTLAPCRGRKKVKGDEGQRTKDSHVRYSYYSGDTRTSQPSRLAPDFSRQTRDSRVHCRYLVYVKMGKVAGAGSFELSSTKED